MSYRGKMEQGMIITALPHFWSLTLSFCPPPGSPAAR